MSVQIIANRDVRTGNRKARRVNQAMHLDLLDRQRCRPRGCGCSGSASGLSRASATTSKPKEGAMEPSICVVCEKPIVDPDDVAFAACYHMNMHRGCGVLGWEE
jgi:hypothetical protein